jgi:hypothetical protein
MVLVETDGRERRPQGDLGFWVSMVLTMVDRRALMPVVLIFYSGCVSPMFGGERHRSLSMLTM